ncbi:MAG TPA: APC family permease [Jatrophihabitantaceae bacterium]
MATPETVVMTSEPQQPKRSLRRNLTVWQAIGLSIALMAPSMAANINPQGMVGTVGRAVPLAFLLAAVGVLLVSYGIVRLCQYYQHSGSVYAFVGATLGPRTGAVSGLALFATYVFYGVVTSCASGWIGMAFLDQVGIVHKPQPWVGFVIAACSLLLALLLTIVPAKGGTTTLLIIEGLTVALIVAVSAIVLVRLLSHNVPNGGHQHFTLDVFKVSSGTPTSDLFLGIVFGFLSFAGFEAASTLGEETANPHRDIPRAILGTAIFGGIYFTVVTAIEMMGFGTGPNGIKNFGGSGALVGDLGRSFVGDWVGDLISLGATISAFACCLACMVGAARLLFAMNRDLQGERGLSVVTRQGTPARSALLVAVLMGAILALMHFAFGADTFAAFLWSGTIGTLILLVAYVLTTIGAMRLLFFQRKMRVPMWQIVIPLAALVVLGYTIYRNVWPYPPMHLDGAENPPFWYPIVAGGWILLCIVLVVVFSGAARQLGRSLAAEEGFMTDQSDRMVQSRA